MGIACGPQLSFFARELAYGRRRAFNYLPRTVNFHKQSIGERPIEDSVRSKLCGDVTVAVDKLYCHLTGVAATLSTVSIADLNCERFERLAMTRENQGKWRYVIFGCVCIALGLWYAITGEVDSEGTLVRSGMRINGTPAVMIGISVTAYGLYILYVCFCDRDFEEK